MFLRENQVGEATKIANSGVIENEVLYFQSIANALSIAIEVFNGNEHKIFLEIFCRHLFCSQAFKKNKMSSIINVKEGAHSLEPGIKEEH